MGSTSGFVCSASFPWRGLRFLGNRALVGAADQDAMSLTPGPGPWPRLAPAGALRNLHPSWRRAGRTVAEPGGRQGAQARAPGRPLLSPRLTVPPLCDLLCHLFSKALFCVSFSVNFWFLQPNNPYSKISTRRGTHEKPLGMCEPLGSGFHGSTRPKSGGLSFHYLTEQRIPEAPSGERLITLSPPPPGPRAPGTTCPGRYRLWQLQGRLTG